MAGTLGVTESVNPTKALIAGAGYGPVLLSAVLTGGPYLSGQILGRITGSGKLTAFAPAALDGSEVPVAVLMVDADASLADLTVMVGFAGLYKESNMLGLTGAAKLALEAKGIYFL